MPTLYRHNEPNATMSLTVCKHLAGPTSRGHAEARKLQPIVSYNMKTQTQPRPLLLLHHLLAPTLVIKLLPLLLQLLLLLTATSTIHCDQIANQIGANSSTVAVAQASNVTSTLSLAATTTTTTTTTTTITTAGAPAAPAREAQQQQQEQQATSTAPTTADYKQRPMPAGAADSSTKISYDNQHELTTTSTSTHGPQQPVSTTATSTPANGVDSASSTGSTSTTPPVTTVVVNSTPASVDMPKRAPGAAGADTDAEYSAPSGSMTVASADESLPAAQTGELLAGSIDSMATASSESVAVGAPDESAPSAASSGESASVAPDQEPSAGAGSSSALISRHGRASAQSYTPPSTSRLSAYSPSMLLQNSRPYSIRGTLDEQPATTGASGSSQTGSIGAQPLHLAHNTRHKHTPSVPFDPIIVCYLGSWSVYRPSLAKFTPENINPFLCTHIIYAFAGLSSKYELKPFDSYNDITQGGYRKFTSLKEHNRQLKTLIAVGGWNEGSAR